MKKVGEGSQNEEMCKKKKVKSLTALTRQSTGPRPVDRFVGIWDFKWFPRFIFSHVSSSSSRSLSIQLSMSDFEVIAVDWRPWIGFLGSLEARVSDLGRILLLPHVTINFFSIFAHLGFRLWVFLSILAISPLFHFFSWLLNESRGYL